MRVLIVEDEVLVAMELEALVSDLGQEPVGIAADLKTAMRLAEFAPDLALVDVNLRDGPTGVEIGQRLVRDHGATVVFMTANPALLGGGVDGAIGVLPKPCSPRDCENVIRYAVGRRLRAAATLPAPPALQLFA
jgi:DNA-binding NarL/FixJ family response regulator